MEFDPQVCEERHKAISTRVTVVMWLIGILLVIAGTGAGFMVDAHKEATVAVHEMDLIKAAQTAHKSAADDDHKQVIEEIERAKLRADERLATAMERVGYQSEAMESRIMYKLDRVAEDVSELKSTGEYE